MYKAFDIVLASAHRAVSTKRSTAEGLFRAYNALGADRTDRSRTEENFQYVKQMQQANLIVPIVGDFTGTMTMRPAGRYVRESWSR